MVVLLQPNISQHTGQTGRELHGFCINYKLMWTESLHEVLQIVEPESTQEYDIGRKAPVVIGQDFDECDSTSVCLASDKS